jgi:hypothetical protein
MQIAAILGDARGKLQRRSFAGAIKEYREIQRHLSSIAVGERERREVARRCLELQLLHACDSAVPAKTVARLIRTFDKLGSSSLARRVELMAIVADWSMQKGAGAARVAREFARDARIRVTRLQKKNPKRSRLLAMVDGNLRSGGGG